MSGALDDRRDPSRTGAARREDFGRRHWAAFNARAQAWWLERTGGAPPQDPLTHGPEVGP